MTFGIPEVVIQIRFRVVSADPTFLQELLELPAGHLREEPRLAERKDMPLIESQGELLEQLAFDLARRQLDGIEDFGGDFQRQLGHSGIKLSASVRDATLGERAPRPSEGDLYQLNEMLPRARRVTMSPPKAW